MSEINDLEASIVSTKRSEYTKLLSSVVDEQDLIEELRSRHPKIGDYLSTRSETDSENPTFQALAENSLRNALNLLLVLPRHIKRQFEKAV